MVVALVLFRRWRESDSSSSDAPEERPWAEPTLWTSAMAIATLTTVQFGAAMDGWLPSAGWEIAGARWLWGWGGGVRSWQLELGLGLSALWIGLTTLQILVEALSGPRFRGRRAA